MLTFSIASDANDIHTHAWAPAGITEVNTGADVEIFASFADELIVDGIPVDGKADRSTHAIVIKRGLSDFRRAVIVAHEVGHVVLDTPKHGPCGIMAGADVILCDADRALACELVGACR